MTSLNLRILAKNIIHSIKKNQSDNKLKLYDTFYGQGSPVLSLRSWWLRKEKGHMGQSIQKWTK